MVAATAPTAAGAMTAGAMLTGAGAWATCPVCMGAWAGAWAGAATSATTGAAAWAVLAPTEVPEMFNVDVCKPAAQMHQHEEQAPESQKCVRLGQASSTWWYSEQWHTNL